MPFSNPSLPSVPDGLDVDDLKLDAAGLLINARTTAAEAPCPSCGRSSTRVHSTYWRTLKDLPWQDRAVTWHIKVRRFRCSHCPGRVFAERVPGFSARKALRSDRLAAAQTDIGLVLGGEPGARLSRRLAMPVSGDTVLRLIRQREIEPCSPPRVVGIDDWAWRRGRFGCDAEGVSAIAYDVKQMAAGQVTEQSHALICESMPALARGRPSGYRIHQTRR